jgi:hypothetical protein
MTDTATVETLTAEVRVLMVGNRQITLSVARQLDHVSLDQMETFGRVRINDGNTVIGRARNGSLAIAQYNQYYRPKNPMIYISDLDRPVGLHRTVAAQSRHGEWYRLRIRSVTFDLEPEGVDICNCPQQEPLSYPERWTCPDVGWDPRGQEDDIHGMVLHRQAKEQELQKLHQSAAAAPLIVLAGLK